MSRDSIKAVQAYLNATTGSRLSVDGKMGPATMKALNSHKNRDELLAQLSVKLDVKSPPTYTREQLREFAQIAAADSGAPEDYMMYVFYQENFPFGDGIRTEFEGTFQGIGQCGEPMWADVGFTNFPVEVRDPVKSAIAVGRYYMQNRRQFLRKFPGRPYTNEVAYTHHLLGPGGATAHLSGQSVANLSHQSTRAKQTAATARRQVNGGESSNFRVS